MIIMDKTFDQEEFNLFNPAYCGFLILNSIREYQQSNKKGFPSSLVYTILPIIMTKAITDSFPRTTSTSFVTWVMDNNHNFVNFDERVMGFFEVTQEAIHFLMSNKTININENGLISYTSKSVKKSSKIFNQSSTIKKQVSASNLFGKWMATQESTTVYSLLGIRP